MLSKSPSNSETLSRKLWFSTTSTSFSCLNCWTVTESSWLCRTNSPTSEDSRPAFVASAAAASTSALRARSRSAAAWRASCSAEASACRRVPWARHAAQAWNLSPSTCCRELARQRRAACWHTDLLTHLRLNTPSAKSNHLKEVKLACRCVSCFPCRQFSACSCASNAWVRAPWRTRSWIASSKRAVTADSCCWSAATAAALEAAVATPCLATNASSCDRASSLARPNSTSRHSARARCSSRSASNDAAALAASACASTSCFA
mmetsp:Transcript_56656/g.151721  ORF Transcript_56656/g.151721 Transcript_56656/m.151721 type:complete len:263 (+) Transcript_56656:251-1039(+)